MKNIWLNALWAIMISGFALIAYSFRASISYPAAIGLFWAGIVILVASVLLALLTVRTEDGRKIAFRMPQYFWFTLLLIFITKMVLRRYNLLMHIPGYRLIFDLLYIVFIAAFFISNGLCQNAQKNLINPVNSDETSNGQG